MEFKTAWKLVFAIHDQCGDRDGWNNHRERLIDDMEKYDSFDQWQNKLSIRSDISDDERWDIECFDASIEVLFKLVKDSK